MKTTMFYARKIMKTTGAMKACLSIMFGFWAQPIINQTLFQVGIFIQEFKVIWVMGYLLNFLI
jgi:hypothetical protein